MALSMDEREKILEIARSLNERNRRERIAREAELRDRIAAAKAEIDRLVARFREADPHLHRVVLFGSLARNRVRGIDFDIDLAVSSERYMDLLGIALDSPFDVDLVDLDHPSPFILAAIERDGVEIFIEKMTALSDALD